MKWPWSRQTPAVAPVNNAVVASTDPRFAGFFHPFGWSDIGGRRVNESQAMSIAALWRALLLVSGTLASLPFRTYTSSGPDAARKVVGSIFDDPDPNGQTPYEWKESAFLHLLLYGRCGAPKMRNAGGAVAALPLAHPSQWAVRQPVGDEAPVGGVWFDVTLQDGTVKSFDREGFWYVPAPSFDGQIGMGLLEFGRLTLASAAAGDKAAGNMLQNGAMISGVAVPADDEDITDDVPEIRRQLNSATSGVENAGAIAVINRRLTLQPWGMTNADAQFLQQRQFTIEEVSRFTGVPPHLLMQVEKQTSWGTGVDEQNRGLSRFVLGHWAKRFEERASRELAQPRWAEFDFAGLERPNFAGEVELLLKQTGGKPILTVNEARKIRNLEPVAGGDVLLEPAPAPAPAPVPATDPEVVPDATQ